MSPNISDIKEQIFLPFREAGIITEEKGFTQILDREDDTHTRTFIDQQQSPEHKQENESQLEEEDDILDEEEYKRMIDKKRHIVRFSNLKDGLLKNDRRLSLFNPLDPNNAQQALRFLKFPLRRMATRKLSKAAKHGPVIEGEEISGESNLSESMIQEEQSGVHIVEEPQDYIFEEHNRIKLGGIRSYKF